MPSEQDRTADRVLRTILSSTSETQGDAISKGALYLQCVGHADMKPDQVDQALHQLMKADKIQIDNGEYRPIHGVDHLKSQGR